MSSSLGQVTWKLIQESPGNFHRGTPNAILRFVKILLVHEIDYVNKPFFEFQEFSEGLSKLGHEVAVLHVQEFQGQSEKKLKTKVRMTGLHLTNVSFTLYSPMLVVTGIVTRFLVVFEHLKLLIRIFSNDRPDVVLSYSVPTSGISLSLLGKLFGVPVVHRAIDVSHLLRAKFLAPLVRFTEIAVFFLSDSVSTHNKALGAYVRRTVGNRKMVTLEDPPVYPVSVLRNHDGTSGGHELRLIFVGSLAHFTDLEGLFLSLSTKNTSLDIKLRIVGSGAKESELMVLAKKLGLENTVEFRGWRTRENLAEELAWADIGIVPFKQNELTHCALPHKSIEYLSAGLPVVSTRLDGAESVLGEITGMYFVNSAGEMLDRCESLFQDRKLGEVDSALVNARFGRELTVRNMEKMLLHVSQGNKK